MKLTVFTSVAVGVLLLSSQTAQAGERSVDAMLGAVMVKTSGVVAPRLSAMTAFLSGTSSQSETQPASKTVQVLIPIDGKATTVSVEPTLQRTSGSLSSGLTSPSQPRVMELTW